MSFDPHIVLTILAMAAATAFTRLSGYWIISLVEPGPRLRRFLDTAPQTVFVAMIAPPIWNGGPAEWMGAVAAAAAMKLSGNLALTIATGVGTTAVIRYLL